MGDVFTLDAARTARAVRRQHALTPENADWWRADLDTWPAAFRRRLGPRLALSDRDGRLAGPGYLATPDVLERRRLASGIYSQRWLMRQLALEFRSIHADALEYRAARRYGKRRFLVERRKATLRESRDRVLWCLWAHGLPRIERSTFEPNAREENTRELAQQRDFLSGLEQRRSAARALLERGCFVNGTRKGYRYTNARREGLECEAQGAAEAVAECQRRVAVLESEPDPLRVCGLYARRTGARL